MNEPIAARVTKPTYNRQQLLKNLENSRLARESSRFKNYVAREKFTTTLAGMSLEDSQRYIQWHKYAKAGLGPVDRAKFQDWKFTPDIDLYLSNKHIYDNPDYFNQLDGSVIYPGTLESALGRIDGSVHKQGFLNGEYVDDIIDPGTLVDRYGNNNTGRYFSPAGASFGERALPPYMEKMPKKTYITIKPISNKKGPVAPWFDQPGMGTQYFTDMEVGYLEKYGYLVEID